MSHGREPFNARRPRRPRATVGDVLLWTFLALSAAYAVFLLVLALSR